MKSPNHFANSVQVLVFNCFSVLAVTTPRIFGKVEKAHKIIQAASADFPIPWPEAVASRTM
jgi:hypothetical protein